VHCESALALILHAQVPVSNKVGNASATAAATKAAPAQQQPNSPSIATAHQMSSLGRNSASDIGSGNGQCIFRDQAPYSARNVQDRVEHRGKKRPRQQLSSDGPGKYKSHTCTKLVVQTQPVARMDLR